ncbi:TonB-linked SusC/RagA family outer membrane protein [Chitinophaga niastensis]|uniref:TonB-linked SusC/RagA family outer membrane protein n=1 Tax=Chitinophaga niastensis TaxID=536980 RepID=A0A2P8HK59_CHINA|nr:TonB-dependent receptor [Chitinophaga niastensis]PSL46591.1 TonB-linked SusC/RagA family outer membrane protein [Chitinophaga niastensis]
MKERLLSTFLFLLFYASSWAQQGISGTVTDKSSGQPIIGATITTGKKGAVTDAKGKFSMVLPPGTSTINITSIGYKQLVVPVTAADNYNIAMEIDERSLEQFVVVGYGTQKKANLTGAVTTVDVTKTMEGRPVTDPSKALQGVAPGLNISFSNGGLTQAPRINIRGIGSVNGTSSPLILVDNVETPDLTLINPEDIESISVLKDAASTSIYGARAAFGVVLIKTKSGRRNTPTVVRYSNNFGWSTPTILPNFADPEKELTGLYEGATRAGTTSPELFGMQLLKLRDGIKNWKAKYAGNRTSNEMVPGEDFVIDPAGGPTYFYRIWDAKDMMLKKWTPQQIHSMSIRGGTEKLAYSISGGYSNTGGILKMNPDNIKKYNITGSISASVTKWLDVDLKMMYRNFEYDYPYQYQGYFYYMWRWGAFFPYGTYQGKYFHHTPGYLANAQTNTLTDNYQRINLGATLKVTKDLNIRADYTIGRDNAVRHVIGGKVIAWDYWASGPLSLGNIATPAQDVVAYQSGSYKVNTFNMYATYDKRLSKSHQLKLMAGINAEDEDTINFSAYRRNVLDPTKAEIPLASGDQLVDGNHLANAYAGFFGRINYIYKDKWMLELNGRYDGASAFPPAYRWAFFPSASMGYRITEEAFMQSFKKVLSDMKFRASYGTLGNQDMGGKWYIPSMSTNNQVNWMNGGNYASGVNQPIAVANSLTWEKVRTLDVGTDISLLNNHIGVTVDWYQRSTDGMLTNKAIPATFGTGAPRINNGALRTRGYEIAVDANYNLSKDWMIYGTLAFWDNKTVITQWDNPSLLISQNYKGKNYGEIWGFETDRYFTKDDNMAKMPDQSKLQDGNFVYGPGDIKYKDLDGNGVIDGGKATLTDHGDLKVIGNTLPRYQYSMRIGSTFKNFDIDIFLQGVGKQDYWGFGDLTLPMYRGSDILYANQLDYWTPDNMNAYYPRPYAGNANGKIAGLANGGNNFYPQSRYLLNLAYLRLKNITLGYTLPAEISKRIHIQRLRIYGSGQNLGEISNVGAPIDPEITTGESGFTGRTFPFQRTWSFGVQVTL